jgi:flagellar biosynthesis component FlhA
MDTQSTVLLIGAPSLGTMIMQAGITTFVLLFTICLIAYCAYKLMQKAEEEDKLKVKEEKDSSK